MARLVVGFAALVVLTAFAPAPKPKPGNKVDLKQLLKKLEGTWELVSLERNTGNPAKTTARSSRRYRFEGDKWSYVYPSNVKVIGSPAQMGGDLKIDTTKSPPTMDMLRNPLPGQTTPPAMMRGIVKVEGDTIKFCYSLASGTDRPTSFDKLEPNQILMTLKRSSD